MMQGFALEVPGCHRRLTFTFGRLEKLTFAILAEVLGAQDFMVMNLWAPCNFSLDHDLVMSSAFLFGSLLLFIKRIDSVFTLILLSY